MRDRAARKCTATLSLGPARRSIGVNRPSTEYVDHGGPTTSALCDRGAPMLRAIEPRHQPMDPLRHHVGAATRMVVAEAGGGAGGLVIERLGP